jgi:hypothetical protein
MSSIRPLGRMLVSRSGNKTVDIDISKVSLGSFFTTQSGWLTNQVRSFLDKALAESGGNLLDPFAGDGHLLNAVANHPDLEGKVVSATGFDIQGDLWPVNDSLVLVPNPQRAIILTNPPYLANHSAKRKGVDSLVAKYFENSKRSNLYQIALDHCLASADYVVAVVPETFLLSSYPKNRLQLAVVIQDELFGDTEAPALVACFGKQENFDADIFTGATPVGKLSEILALRIGKTSSKAKIVFNYPAGRIGLRAVDGSDGQSAISFMLAADFGYSSKKVLGSSRLMTYLEIPNLEDRDVGKLIDQANSILARIRLASSDLVLAPFKGNDRNGQRRRRLDYGLARKILNEALDALGAKSR